MSDTIGPHPGSRNIDTAQFRIVSALPNPELGGPGDLLTWWPQGETFANLNGCLRAIQNADVLAWEQAGKIARIGQAKKPSSGIVRQSIAVTEERVG